MSASNVAPDRALSSGKPTAVDIVFLLSMVGLMALVAFLGRLTFQEGVKTEITKSQAETLVGWMKEASGRRSGEDFQPSACAYKTAGSAEVNLWRPCAHALLSDKGPLANATNAFTGEPIAFVERCNPSDLATAGRIVADKISSTPPGSAVPIVVGPMADDERIGQKLMIRIAICDKGGYAIRVGETEF